MEFSLSILCQKLGFHSVDFDLVVKQKMFSGQNRLRVLFEQSILSLDRSDPTFLLKIDV